ncbi:multicopper oxidase domain-containing protein [Lapillicoccus sp.]|uniref:multicopper oxidase domain-containing protein n=1 Tax=Lapillicoccus sp. TaxID=1909287 RepID=UPI0025F74B5F|nr:multicopper oxidase domain-containing protein [Lapillicoccus sp.]
MSMPVPSRNLRRLAAVTGAVVVTTLALPIGPASGLAAPASPPAVAAPATQAGAASVARAAAAAPVGRLTPRGCTVTGSSDACDLYATAGTQTIVGTSVPIWGFSSSAPTTAPDLSVVPTAPGPGLVVRQGDSVSITLHNGIAGENLSLAFPGVPVASFSAGLDSTVGVGAGAARTYSFTASRAGTFLYEAGHTANGSRQAAMGLVGALVVLPADGTAYGTPASAYDDEAVMVLTEVDPALNAHPDTFDMRLFKPTYRLVNGNSFPEIPAVPTDQGHTVLVRWVNGGAVQHPMTALGASALAIARDGHVLAYPEREVTAAVDPGTTEDTLLTMTTGPESKVTLYESGTHLDNNSQHTADPLQTAFGGMMTVLDTNAPLPPTDTVGPVTSAVAASPNPSTGQTDVTITAQLSDLKTGNSGVAAAEYVVDDAQTTGPGNGTPMVMSGPGDSATGTLSVATMATLDAGRHVIYVRAKDNASNGAVGGNWGVVGSVVFNLPKTGPSTTAGVATPAISNLAAPIVITATGDDSSSGHGNITRAELYVTDADVMPTDAPGTGAAMTNNRVAPVVSETGSVSSATEGYHFAWVRSMNTLGLWGPFVEIPFTVDQTGPSVTGAAIGPNPSNGLVSAPANPGYAVVSGVITDAGTGNWGSKIVDAEAFLDTVGVNGGGVQMIPVDGALDSTTESVYGLIPLSAIRTLPEGTHPVFVHGQDAAGNWGPTFTASFLVDKTAPTLGALTVTPNPTNGAALITARVPYTDASGTIGAAEFWFGTADPGVGRATPITVSLGTDGVASIDIPTSGIAAGTQTLNVRIADKAGNWSGIATTPVTVVPPPVLADTFDGTLNPAWAVTAGPVGTIGVSPSANLPAAAATKSGVLVTYPTTGGARQPAYITRSFGTSLTTAHVDIDVDATTLATGGATPTILAVRTATGGNVFAVQLRTVGAGATATRQVRTLMFLPGGGNRQGAWVTIPNGPVTLSLVWRSGRAAGATPGSLTLALQHGAVASTTTGNTGTLQAAAIAIGVQAGQTPAVRGTLALDNLTVAP